MSMIPPITLGMIGDTLKEGEEDACWGALCLGLCCRRQNKLNQGVHEKSNNNNSQGAATLSALFAHFVQVYEWII